MLLIWGTGSGERVREGTGKLKIGTNPNLNPSPFRNFISNSRNLFPLFIFPFPVLVPCSFFLVLVTCNWIQWMRFMWTTASESIQPALKLVWVWLNSNSIRVIRGTAYEPGPNSPVSSKTWTLNESSKDACLHVYMAKTSPSRRVTLQAESTLWLYNFMWEKGWFLCSNEQRSRMTVSPWLSCSGSVSQGFYMEKSWCGCEGDDLNITKEWPGWAGSPRVAWPGRWPLTINWALASISSKHRYV